MLYFSQNYGLSFPHVEKERGDSLPDRISQILGNYKLVQLLGQGGFADVYLGEHVHLNTFAAIKILRAQLEEDSVENFRSEARTLAHLKHPNIVQVLDFGVDGLTPYLVMQYASNGTLRQRHPRGTQVSLNVVLSYVKQLSSALQYAHSQKLIHRDIKPENMLVGEFNQILLSDFGIAVMTASARAADPALMAKTYETAGTAYYMAPEQIQGKTIPASDQYSLAVVVYEWLTGELPFKGSYIEVVSQQIYSAPASLREKVQSISSEIDQVVLTALHKDPQRRFKHIEAFAKAMEQAAQDSVPASSSVSSTSMSNIRMHPQITSEVSTMEASLLGPFGRTLIGTTTVTIGRAPDNTLVLSDGKASSHHAEIHFEAQYYNLVDLSSTNGTFVNGQQVFRGAPRVLQPGDTIRIGDTMFTFEMRNPQLGTQSSDGSTVFSNPPPPPVMPNPGGNTSYGMENMYGSGQSGEGMALSATSPSFTPPGSANPYQQSSNPPPPPPSYVSQPQMSGFVPPSNTPSGQGPLYTPSPPVYTPPTQPRKRSPVLTIVLAVIALVIILAAVFSFLIYQSGQTAQHNANATATVRTQTQNNATATVLAQQNATATVVASATAIATSHYPPFTTVALDDSLTSSSSSWSSSASCQFSSTGYQISVQQASTFQYCLNSGQFGEMAYQVTTSITQGDCAGLVFRYIDNNNFLFFKVCQNGQYNLGDYVNNNEKDIGFHANSAIKQGVNQQNVIAVTVQGDTINLYVNGKNIDSVTTSILTSRTFSKGEIGLLADDISNPTSVIYSKALLWT
jgi:serine/threonine protein kinase